MAELQGPPTVARDFWGAVVEPGKPYVRKPSPQGGHIRIRSATLGSTDALSSAILEYTVGDMVPIRLCVLNSSRTSYHLDLDSDLKQNVTFSVIGNSSIHLWGSEDSPVGNAASFSCVKTRHRGGPSNENKNDVNHSCHDNKRSIINIDDDDDEEEVVDLTRATKRSEDSLATGDTKLKRVKRKSNVDESFGTARSGWVCPRATKAHELIIQDLEVGSDDGKKASNGSKVTVKYVGELMDGKVVDPLDTHEFDLGARLVIRGWDLGIVGMRVGGKRKLIIPPSLAFGEEAGLNGKVPPNSWLVYKIELTKVKKRAPCRIKEEVKRCEDEDDGFSVNL